MSVMAGQRLTLMVVVLLRKEAAGCYIGSVDILWDLWEGSSEDRG